MLKDEREKVRTLEEKACKEADHLTLQVRELRVKLSTSRMREEDYLRTISDMQKATDIKKSNNQVILDNLTTQNDKFKSELELIGKKMLKLSSKQQSQKPTTSKPRSSNRA